ncbi:MAG: hypothetical protein E7269_07625 [Lachnospiraceae bacterium]|nr:hypothetical protein [Lachnospiraceae bacterium]
MILEDAKLLLVENNISFETVEYRDEKEYWHHTMLFPYTKNAKSCKVIAIVVKSNNGNKNIELQFNETDAGFVFEELRFGDLCFEFFDVLEEVLVLDLILKIKKIQEGKLTVVLANNLKKRCWIGDAVFDLNDDDDLFGKKGYEEAMQRIRKPYGLLGKLFKSKIQYEIYDWNSYQCIIK